MNKNTYEVVSLITTDTGVTLITTEGESITLSLSDPRTKGVVSKFTSDIVENNLKVSTITLGEREIVNHYKKLEEITNKLIQFEYKLEEVTNKLSEVIAILPNGVRIDNVNKIEKYIVDAVEKEQPEGVVNLLKRVGKVIESRNFRTQDLLDFLRTTKLPITNKGDIVFLKSVNLSTDGSGEYVDWYTGVVKQSVGTLVTMDKELVDNDRDISCSNGLHIASLEYVSKFHGHTVLMGIVEPESIIAVPAYDNTKVRCSSYFITHELKIEDVRELYSGNTNILTYSEEFRNSLNDLLSGKCPEITHITNITSSVATKDTVFRTALKDAFNKSIDNSTEPTKSSLVREVEESPTLVKAVEKNPIKPSDVAKKLSIRDRLIKYINLAKKANTEDDEILLAESILEIKRKQKKSFKVLLGDDKLAEYAEYLVKDIL